MRDEDRGDALLVVEPAQPGPQLGADVRVQRAERLVEQQHARLDGERSCERHPLALAAGELVRALPGPGGEADQREQLVDALADLVLRALADLQAERDVVADAHVCERRVVLEHETDPAVLWPCARDVIAVDQHRAAVGSLEPRDDSQQRRLPRAARAQQRRQ